MNELERFFQRINVGVWILLGGGLIFVKGFTPLVGWVLIPLGIHVAGLLWSHPLLRWIHLLVDTVGILGLGMLTGIPQSPFLMFLILPLMEASLFYPKGVGWALLLSLLLLLAVGEGEISRRYFLAGLFLLSTALGLHMRERIGELHHLYERIRLDRKTILDNMTSGVVAFSPSGGLLYDNPAARRMLPSQGYPILARYAQKALKQGIHESEIVIDNRVYGIGWIPIQENQGILAIFLDITEKRQMQQRLQALARWETLGMFSSHLAHEIRSALMTLQGVLEMWDNLDDPSRKARYRNHVTQALSRLQELVEQFLSYARVNSPLEIQPYPLSRVAQYIHDTLGIPIHTQGEKIVKTDLRRIQWIVRNLVENAMRYSQTVSVYLLSPTMSYHDELVSLSIPPDRWALIVRDQGPGIPESYRDRIFEPFFTTESSGFGLGLTIVRETTEQMGGTVRVFSKKNVGTAFVILLPLQISEKSLPQPFSGVPAS